MIDMPLARIGPGRLRRVAVPALVLYALALLPFVLVGEPNEMIRLQLAGSVSKAHDIVSSWSNAATVDMAFLQGVDELHPLVYGLLLALGAIWAGRRLAGRGARWAPFVAWLALTAGAFDLLENVGMVVMIRGDVEAPWPTVTTAFAIVKFSLIVVAVVYLIAGLVAGRHREGASAPS